MKKIIWFDVTYLINWNGSPVGIVRVLIELALIYSQDRLIKFCIFNSKLNCFEEVPVSIVIRKVNELHNLNTNISNLFKPPKKSQLGKVKQLATKAIINFLPENKFKDVAIIFSKKLSEFYFNYVLLPNKIYKLKESNFIAILFHQKNEILKKIIFNANDVYLNCGLSWENSALASIYLIKKKRNVRVVTFCYDLIPVTHPEYYLNKLTRLFVQYFKILIKSSDSIICISNYTRKILCDWSTKMQLCLKESRVITPGGDSFSTRNNGSVSNQILNIANSSFILYVSTIEIRKNHRVLLNAYKSLLEKHSHNVIPKMLWVGKIGWGISDLLAELEDDSQLKKYVAILDNVNDTELELLYKRCQFTVFPSLIEGWGLPITESLKHGKLCVTACNSSLPEATGNFSYFIEENTPQKWEEMLWSLFINKQLVKKLNSNIKRLYRPKKWIEFASELKSVCLK